MLMLRLVLDISTAACFVLRVPSEPKAREDLLILIQFLVTALLAFSLHTVSLSEKVI